MGNDPIHLLNIRRNLYSRLGLRLRLNRSFSCPHKRKQKFLLHLHSCLESRLCWLFNAVFYPNCILFMFLLFYFIGVFLYLHITITLRINCWLVCVVCCISSCKGGERGNQPHLAATPSLFIVHAIISSNCVELGRRY